MVWAIAACSMIFLVLLVLGILTFADDEVSKKLEDALVYLVLIVVPVSPAVAMVFLGRYLGDKYFVDGHTVSTWVMACIYPSSASVQLAEYCGKDMGTELGVYCALVYALVLGYYLREKFGDY